LIKTVFFGECARSMGKWGELGSVMLGGGVK